MTPDERRTAIIEATLPLLLTKGPELSTREIAQAAGVAEGTIFRVFTTKQELVQATISKALRPDATLAKIQALPQGQSLSARVSSLLAILRAELKRTRALFTILFGSEAHPHPAPGQHPHDGFHQAKIELGKATAEALHPYADQLRIPLASAARILLPLSIAASFTSDQPLADPDQLADTVLFGIAERNQ